MNKEELNTFVYHEVHAPKGKRVTAEDALAMYKKGWVDTPAKFGKGFRSNARKAKNAVIETKPHIQFIKLIKWLLTIAIPVILTFYLTKALYDKETESKALQKETPETVQP